MSLFECPFGCDTFPYDSAADLVDHISEKHVPVAARSTLEAAFVPQAPPAFGTPVKTPPVFIDSNDAKRYQTVANGFGGTTATKADPHLTVTTMGDFEALVRAEYLDRKLTDLDVTPALKALAIRWMGGYTGDFEFVVGIKQDLAKYGAGSLSTGKIRGILNCMRADVLRKAAPAPAEAIEFNLRDLPEGAHGVLHVAIPDQEEGHLLFLDIHQRAGKLVVTQMVGGNDDLYLGQQVDGQPYRGKRIAELKAILADPKAALKAYGDHFTRCGICATPLSDDTSVKRGVGPKCWAKAGW